MENPIPQGMPAPQPKKSNTGLIIGVVVAILVCCCCIIVIAGGFYLQSSVSGVYSSINEQLTALPESFPDLPESTMEPSMPEENTDPSSPAATDVPFDLQIPADAVPQGGLGDDILRTQSWTYALLTVSLSGCTSPVAKDTTIEVLQEPDSNGVWIERWTVACDGSDPVPVEITFTPSSSGGTDISVTLAK